MANSHLRVFFFAARNSRPVGTPTFPLRDHTHKTNGIWIRDIKCVHTCEKCARKFFRCEKNPRKCEQGLRNTSCNWRVSARVSLCDISPRSSSVRRMTVCRCARFLSQKVCGTEQKLNEPIVAWKSKRKQMEIGALERWTKTKRLRSTCKANACGPWFHAALQSFSCKTFQKLQKRWENANGKS